MACSISAGSTFTCADKSLVGGTQSYVYLANLSNVASFTETLGAVSAITFDNAPGLIKFEIAKNSGSAGSEIEVQDGGNKLWKHSVNFNISALDQDDVNIVEDLARSEVIAIFVDRNKTIRIYGRENGLDLIADVQNTGTVAGSNVLAQLQLQGQEGSRPQQFLATDYETSIALLESYLF